MVRNWKGRDTGARPGKYKRWLSRGGRWLLMGKKANKWVILFVGFIMVFSGLFIGLNREMPNVSVPENGPVWNVVNYDSVSSVGTVVVARIDGPTGSLKIVPKRLGTLDTRTINDIFDTNITGISRIVLENATGYEMFNIETDGSNVTAQIRKRIRVSGDYFLFTVYRGSTQYGYLDVIGDGLRSGDFVNLLLLQRSVAGRPEFLGFIQSRVEEGPYIRAKVVGFEGLMFSGLFDGNLSESDFEAALNASGVRFGSQSANSTSKVVSFDMPMQSNVSWVEGVLASMNVSNFTVGKLGYAKTAPNMAYNGTIVSIPGNDRVQTTFRYNTTLNDTVTVGVYAINFGNQSIVFAIESSGNDTKAQ